MGDRLRARIAPYVVCLAVGAALAAACLVALAEEPHLSFARRPALLLLAGVPLLAVYQIERQRRRRGSMLFSRTRDLSATARGLSHHLVHLPRALRLGALALLVIALARPQHESALTAEVEGIDIVLALDVSNSMSERDLAPDRITAAKAVLKRFIARRKSDRIGLVIFGREAFTQCPLTLDYRALTGLLEDVRIGLVDGHGTAIGNALGTALNRLRPRARFAELPRSAPAAGDADTASASAPATDDGPGDARSRVIILLTDGDNNAGNLAPEQAARYAQALGVKIFTILVGRDAGGAADPPVPGTDRFGRLYQPPARYPVNPKLLESIASATGGTPYLATDGAALEQRFQSILDELDRSKVKESRQKPAERYPWFVAPALALLLVELALELTRFRRFP